MMKLKITALIACLCFLGSVSAKNLENSQQLKINNLYTKIAKKEALRKQLALELAPIKNELDLSNISTKKSALDLLSASAKERFLESITFGSNGVTGFRYAELEAELTPTQIYKVLSLFGIQHTVSNFVDARVETATDALLLNSDIYEFSTISSSNGLERFGFGMPGTGAEIFADHKGYACTGRATCSERQGSICMSGC